MATIDGADGRNPLAEMRAYVQYTDERVLDALVAFTARRRELAPEAADQDARELHRMLVRLAFRERVAWSPLLSLAESLALQLGCADEHPWDLFERSLVAFVRDADQSADGHEVRVAPLYQFSSPAVRFALACGSKRAGPPEIRDAVERVCAPNRRPAGSRPPWPPEREKHLTFAPALAARDGSRLLRHLFNLVVGAAEVHEGCGVDVLTLCEHLADRRYSVPGAALTRLARCEYLRIREIHDDRLTAAFETVLVKLAANLRAPGRTRVSRDMLAEISYHAPDLGAQIAHYVGP